MATEEKKYLVNVESNLDEYAKEVVKADQAVNDFIQANKDLLATNDKSNVEYVKAKAQLSDLQKERASATKNVETFQKALNSETTSRKQLGEVLKLQQQALGKVGDAYIKNEKGLRTINPLYIKQQQNIKATKDAIIEYDKAQGDGRSSVGLYSEAIGASADKFAAIPGPIGQAGAAVSRYSKVLMANPIVAIAAAITAAIALLVKAFRNSQPLMDAWGKVSAAISATFKVLIDRISNFVELIGSVFSKELRESRKAAKALNDELIGIEETMTRREKRELRRANKKGFFEEIKEEVKAAVDLTEAEQNLEDREISWIQTRANLQRQIEELKNSSKDENLTNKEKLKNLDLAIAKTKELTATEIEFAKERARISNERTIQGNSTRDELRANEELQAAASEAEAAGLKLQKAILSERFTLVKQVAIEEQKLKEQIEQEKAAADLEILKAKGVAEMQAVVDLLNEKKAVEIQIAEETGADVLAVQRKYAEAEILIAQYTKEQKIGIAGEIAGGIAVIFGQSSAIGKAAAIAATTINTYEAAMAAYKSMAGIPLIGQVLAAVQMAAAIATGAATVKKIMSVKVPGGGGGGGSAPTAITSSAPAQRVFASSVGSSAVTQPQLGQTQLNALPNEGNLLTAADIAKAISELPPPVVTVEAYENVSNAKKKIEVRANI